MFRRSSLQPPAGQGFGLMYERTDSNIFEPVIITPQTPLLNYIPAHANNGYTPNVGDERGIFVLANGYFPQSTGRAIAYRNNDPLGLPDTDITYDYYFTGVTGYSFAHTGLPDIHNGFIADAILKDDDTRGGVAVTEIVNLGSGFDAVSHSYAETPLAETSVEVVGSSVDGNFLAMGMTEHDSILNGKTGTVYVYKQTSPGVWTFHQQLSPPSLSAGDRFGHCIRMRDGVMIVGAPGELYPNPSPPQSPARGSIYVFEYDSQNDTWVESQQLAPGGTVTPTPLSINFGTIFDFHHDLLVAGNPQHDLEPQTGPLVDAAGAVHIWTVFNDCNNNGIDDAIEIANGDELDINLNGIPDCCDTANGFTDCNSNCVIDDFEANGIFDVVFLFDTSPSIDTTAAEVCSRASGIKYQILDQDLGARFKLMSIRRNPKPGAVGDGFSCLDVNDDVYTLYCGTPSALCQDIEATETSPTNIGNADECWGPGLEILAEEYDWLPGAKRVIIPISDVGVYNAACDPARRDRAIATALANDVIVMPIMVDNSDICAIAEGQQIADETQGVGVGEGVLTILDDGDNFEDEITQFFLDIGQEFDCNDNGIPDDCPGECLADADITNDGVITGADFTAWIGAFNANDPAADSNCNGVFDGQDFTAWLILEQNGVVGCP